MPHFSRRPRDLRTRASRSPWYKCRCNSRCIIEENLDTKDIDDGRGKDKETNQGEDASGGSE